MPTTRTPHRRPRPPCIPPPPARETGADLPGHEVLAELPGEHGLRLWLLLRDLFLWATVPAGIRSRLFTVTALDALREAAFPEAIAGAVQALCTALQGRDAAPAVLPCRTIARWALPGAPRTALHFARIAAVLDPEASAPAREAACAALANGDLHTAESWARRAGIAARRNRERRAHVRATTQLGEILTLRGEAAEAFAAFQRSSKAARRYGLPPAVRARALLGLLRLSLHHGLGDRDHLVRQLLTTSGRDATQLVRIRLATARVLMEGGEYGLALRVLLSRRTGQATGEDRVAVLRLRARAAAAAGARRRLRRAWGDVVSLLGKAAGSAEAEREVEQLFEEIAGGLPPGREAWLREAIGGADGPPPPPSA